MTVIRRLALKISNEVMIWASPGSKEWAEGLAREVEFIESDWAALHWAIGSTRVLLDRRDAPIGSLDDALTVAKEYRGSFGNRLKSATPYFLWVLGVALLWLFIPSRMYSNPMMRVGGCLMAGAILYDGYRALVYRRRKTDQPINAYAWALYYRSELQRDLEFNTGRVSWLSSAVSDAGMCLFYGGLLNPFYTQLPVLFVVLIAFLYMLTISVGVFRKYVYCRKLQWKIVDLDALIARGAGV
jgi:hypothetical protein